MKEAGRTNSADGSSSQLSGEMKRITETASADTKFRTRKVPKTREGPQRPQRRSTPGIIPHWKRPAAYAEEMLNLPGERLKSVKPPEEESKRPTKWTSFCKQYAKERAEYNRPSPHLVPIPQGRQPARAIRSLILNATGPVTINLQGIVSAPERAATHSQQEISGPTRRNRRTGHPRKHARHSKVIHQKIAARHGRKIIQQGKRWNITPTAQQNADEDQEEHD